MGLEGKLIQGNKLCQSRGTGTFGEVFLAKNVDTGIESAIKILIFDLGSADEKTIEEMRKILTAEAVSLRGLDNPGHKGVPHFYNAGIDYLVAARTAKKLDRVAYLMMEFVDGTTLLELLRQGPLPESKVKNYMGQLAEILTYSHKKGIFHGDIKPPNIMIKKDEADKDVAVLLDFGCSRIRGKIHTESTRYYRPTMYTAPERISMIDERPRITGEPTAESDQYSLGIVAMHMRHGEKHAENYVKELCEKNNKPFFLQTR